MRWISLPSDLPSTTLIAIYLVDGRLTSPQLEESFFVLQLDLEECFHEGLWPIAASFAPLVEEMSTLIPGMRIGIYPVQQ